MTERNRRLKRGQEGRKAEKRKQGGEARDREKPKVKRGQAGRKAKKEVARRRSP